MVINESDLFGMIYWELLDEYLSNVVYDDRIHDT